MAILAKPSMPSRFRLRFIQNRGSQKEKGLAKGAGNLVLFMPSSKAVLLVEMNGRLNKVCKPARIGSLSVEWEVVAATASAVTSLSISSHVVGIERYYIAGEAPPFDPECFVAKQRLSLHDSFRRLLSGAGNSKERL